MMEEKYKKLLLKYIPPAALEQVYEYLQTHKVHLRISRARASKLGDYRSPHNGSGHKISVNHNLNPYSFLITLIHELAHLRVWQDHKNRVSPHGKEWKMAFKNMMQALLLEKVFPEDVEKALKKYLLNAKASSGSDASLTKVLNKYDHYEGFILEDLQEGSLFCIETGKTFRKGKKLRKRYQCICLENKRSYLVNPVAKVTPVKERP
ncbi:MAG: SprT-like domain-containing protein [Bacteroidota bacterium]|nr:SprT-like domain-containing protein [Bacteroidota bacterium]